MLVGVYLANGKTSSVLVRYSPITKTLYTTVEVVEAKGFKPDDIIGASAPFAIFKGQWTINGLVPEESFFDIKNCTHRIQFLDLSWNYM